MHKTDIIWYVTREYAGIAEAGGVKNVACAIAEGMSRKGHDVTVFMPAYGSVFPLGEILFQEDLVVTGISHSLNYRQLIINGVRIILVDTKIYQDKQAVYTYTEAEARSLPGNLRGKGHLDADIMNVVLQRAVIRYSFLTDIVPDIIHGQDAHSALLPALIRTDDTFSSRFAETLFIVTIHNAGSGYRQNYTGLARAHSITELPIDILSEALLNDSVEPFLLAARYGTLTTVSPWYAHELTSNHFDQFSDGLSGEFFRRDIKIAGITNGIDFNRYDPTDTTKSFLPFAFDPALGDLEGKYKCRQAFLEMIQTRMIDAHPLESFGSLEPEKDAVYFSYHGRIARQKGLDVFEQAATIVLDHLPQARFLVLGQGDSVLEASLIRMSLKYPGRFLYLRGYERSWARLVVAVSDFLVLPSAFEPCGLEDFIGQIFGTITVAHAVGGLQKILDRKTGFLYREPANSSSTTTLANLLLELAAPIVSSDGIGCRAVPEYLQIIRFAASYVKSRYSWDTILTEEYMPLYTNLFPGFA